MTQATDQKPNPAYGAAFAEMHHTVTNLTDEQAASLATACEQIDKDAYLEAVGRLAEVLELIGVDDVVSDENATYPDRAAAYAVLAQDRGLITAADFQTIISPWTTVLLPVPLVFTGDREIPPMVDIQKMTSDALADELLHAAAGTDHYGAVLALTGYNFNELLAYPAVRRTIDRHDDHSFRVGWECLRVELLFDELTEVPEDARDFIGFALTMSPVGGEDNFTMKPAHDDNAEVMLTAVAYTLGVPHMLHAGDVDHPTAAVVPQPRQWEPSA